MATRKFQIGDKVRLTAKFLRNTGQYAGPSSLSVWTITGFTRNGWAITDEPSDAYYYSAEEVAADPTLGFRRIALCHLQKVRKG